MREKRPIRIEGKIAYVPLTKGYEAVIDAADVPLVEAYNWCVMIRPHTVYARRTALLAEGKDGARMLHRIILDAPEGLHVDHIDGNGLDNRRFNLRLATNAQNMLNRRTNKNNISGFKGVSWHKQRAKWRAQISLNGKVRYLGLFDTPEDAHAAYVDASIQFHGEFGRAV